MRCCSFTQLILCSRSDAAPRSCSTSVCWLRHHDPGALGGVANPAPQTSRGLLSVDPDVAKTLRQTHLGPASFNFDNAIGEREVRVNVTSGSVPQPLGTEGGRLWLLRPQVRGEWLSFP
jgi:hypothetical protein